MARIFLSYDRDDGAKAAAIADALQNAGHDLWWDRQISGGSEFNREIEEALSQAEAVVVLWSAQSVQSAWVRDEAAVGRDKGRLVPVTIDGTPPPLGFRQYQTIDLTKGALRRGSRGIRALLDGISRVSGKADQAEQPRWPRHGVTGSWVNRRTVAGGSLAAVALAGGGFWLLRDRKPLVSPEVETLMSQAWQAWTQGTREGSNQAIGLYRRVTEMAPYYADGWGFLACAYADRAHFAPAAERTALRDRARSAGRRALQIDPENAYGRAAVAYARTIIGNWLLMEREFRRAIDDQPGKWLIPYSLALHLTRVGRLSEAADLFGQLKGSAPTAMQYYFHIQALWGAGRIDEAERLLEEASSIYGTHEAIWGTRFQMLLHGGKPGAAIAMAEDKSSRPSNQSEELLDQSLAVARAFASNDPAAKHALAKPLAEQARKSAWLAGVAIEHSSTLGLLDQGFALANAYYFSRGFVVPDSEGSATAEASLDGRETTFLFLPAMRAMRQDRRFNSLVGEIGLERYWREAGAHPDYRKA